MVQEGKAPPHEISGRKTGGCFKINQGAYTYTLGVPKNVDDECKGSSPKGFLLSVKENRLLLNLHNASVKICVELQGS